ncbi:MAG: enediyne biosynthesis protein UnbU [Alphaproteobacteria bacterium]|nr:enediyne biosynthesis protein UnbU [Alphaproteobacteria bacterium]
MNANAKSEAPPQKKTRDPRTGLRTSATLATVFTIIGHSYLGFEQSFAAPVVALVTGYICGLLFEYVDAKANQRPLAFMGGGFKKLVDFLLPTHMTAITLAFLLYSNERVWVIAFAVALAIGSKFFFRVHTRGRYRHFLNPSNFAIAVTLLLFQWTTAIPWGYTVMGPPWLDAALVLFIVFMGTRLNLLFTGRLPLIATFIAGWFVQGAFRAWLTGGPLRCEIVGMTGVAGTLFIFYMITDPMTSPHGRREQMVFGASIAAAYGLCMHLNIQYAIFYSVAIVCAARGMLLFLEDLRDRRAEAAPALQPAPAK